MKFTYNILNLGDIVPPPKEVNAVFLVALQNGKIVTIRNHRGWDLPAGHREEGETVLEALARECQEEASLVYTNAIPFVIIRSDNEDAKYKGKWMVRFVTKECALNEFVPAIDSQERKVMPIDEFLSLYKQDEFPMRAVVEAAQRSVDGWSD